MSVRLRRPSAATLRALLLDAPGAHLTYGPAGVSLSDATPPEGFVRRHWDTELAPSAFEAAKVAITGWRIHRGARLSVEADGPLAVGTHVAMSAPLPIGYVDAVCRVVAVVDEPDRFGFAYGTLPVHPESGEEAFVVTRTSSATMFHVEAVSRPVNPLARLATPVAHALQARAVRRYLAAMLALTGSPPP